ncbi:acetoacetate--CoA ligase [Halopseudomonas salegens]|uniref:Acetoacetyl-CoA synthetase n=1 Tax=Halopseudomonas salegens TaxID=1434072 RepID=A0A1H2HN25_9GAMM|nr:acetoacetate--CoA ligase [Halopseudomonas salegens]SDU32948.1 acetoacetyl-CoA synthetase [Halopseudomonas salegens]
MNDVLWQPDAGAANSQMAHYRDGLQAAGHGPFADYAALHAWSVADVGRFWQSIWEFTGVYSHQPPVKPLARGGMPGAHWFPGAQLNFAENLLRHALHGDASQPALIAYAESRSVQRWSRAALLDEVAALSAWLREQGIQPGDRIAGVMGNTAEAIIVMLACASLGAIWSSASPDFGQAGILDRFGQIEPRLLLAVNGYRYGGKTHDRRAEMQALRARLPSVEQLVMIELLPDLPLPADCLSWADVLTAHAGARPLFTPLPFDHPLYILYSSGTTGVPKCIVHGAGGTLLQHSKELMLHADLGPADVLFYFTTCGWMMWNWLASGLLTGASLVLFEGNPGYPDLQRLWQLAEAEGITHFGTSAKFLGSCRNAGLVPGQQHDLSAMRVLLSTGSPLLPEDFDWVYQAAKSDLLLGSISGGTDIVSCFVGSNPLLPVRRGRIQCRMLGMAVEAFDETGQAVIDQRGELVCTQPAPCMPLGFWNDPQGERYQQAYFSRFPGVWAHGDYVEFAADGSCIIHGRSDATLNPGGVRIGTAEIYRQVETLPAIADSLVVGQDWQGDVRVILLVVLNPGEELDDALRQQIRQRIRDNASPRHVPAVIAAIPSVPYTRSGKKVELAVARLLRGDSVDNREALANPEALDQISQLEQLWQ